MRDFPDARNQHDQNAEDPHTELHPRVQEYIIQVNNIQ